MNQRTEPTKEENEAAIAELKREPLPKFYRNARAGLNAAKFKAYRVVAFTPEGEAVHIADFYWRERKNPGNTEAEREQARIMADRLAAAINAHNA